MVVISILVEVIFFSGQLEEEQLLATKFFFLILEIKLVPVLLIITVFEVKSTLGQNATKPVD